MSLKRKACFVLGVSLILMSVLYYLYYFSFHSVLHITGDIVDDNGNPLATGVPVTEGQFISITKNSYKTFIYSTPNGKFDITTSPCFSVSVDFGLKGFKEQHRSFGQMNGVPIALHIVMHKEMSISALFQPSLAGKYEINAANLHWSNSPYLSVQLVLIPDGTATTITTLADNKTKVNGAGNWIESNDHVSGRIILSVTQSSGAPDPANLFSKPLSLDFSDDGNSLINRSGGPNFIRIK